MTHATPHQAGPDTDSGQTRPTAGPLRDAWHALWAAPALAMVAPRLATPDAWAALALLVAALAVLNADAIARCARRLSTRSLAGSHDEA
jgi:hypothetical protein